MSARRWVHSLRFRLLVATLAALLVALLLAGLLLASLFRDHVLRQFTNTLTAQLDQVTARLEFDPTGQPQLDAQTLSDPRWSRPYSGLYWQIDAGTDKDAEAVAGGSPQRGVLRSRSLWDATLTVPNDALADGSVHVHETTGPDGAPLLLVERSVRREAEAAGTPWRLLVAADLSETEAAADRFNGVLLVSLAVLLGLLCAAAVAQVVVGLSPLRALQRALAAVREGRAPRLEGRFPAEVQALTDDFNSVLDRNAEVVARARTQAGNLAHAIKTPLAAMAQAAQRPEASAELPALVQEQVAVARRHVDWHLARSRAAAALGLPGARVAVAPVVAGLVRVLERVHAERGLTLASDQVDPDASFAGEAQDLQEILGNLLDNACKWARHEVGVSVAAFTEAGGQRQRLRLRIVIEDDGPGIAPAQRQAVMARGERLDESVPGSGLGLAIVHELVHLYGGQLGLDQSALGGLRVELTLPGAAS